jgi:hypothetical protein
MEKIKSFFIKLFNKNKELTKDEEQELIQKIIKKIKES